MKHKTRSFSIQSQSRIKNPYRTLPTNSFTIVQLALKSAHTHSLKKELHSCVRISVCIVFLPFPAFDLIQNKENKGRKANPFFSRASTSHSIEKRKTKTRKEEKTRVLFAKKKWRRSETGKVYAKNGRVVSPFAYACKKHDKTGNYSQQELATVFG